MILCISLVARQVSLSTCSVVQNNVIETSERRMNDVCRCLGEEMLFPFLFENIR